jgi:hypothetical protein
MCIEGFKLKGVLRQVEFGIQICELERNGRKRYAEVYLLPLESTTDEIRSGTTRAFLTGRRS